MFRYPSNLENIKRALRSTNTLQIEALLYKEGPAVLSQKFRIGEHVTNNVPTLSYAVINSHDEVVDILIKAGADVNATESNGFTALHRASLETSRLTKAEILIKGGAKVNACDAIGQTPLHVCAKHGNIDVAILLLRQGADIEVKDTRGRSPIQITTDQNFIKIIQSCIEIKGVVGTTRKKDYIKNGPDDENHSELNHNPKEKYKTQYNGTLEHECDKIQRNATAVCPDIETDLSFRHKDYMIKVLIEKCNMLEESLTKECEKNQRLSAQLRSVGQLQQEKESTTHEWGSTSGTYDEAHNNISSADNTHLNVDAVVEDGIQVPKNTGDSQTRLGLYGKSRGASDLMSHRDVTNSSWSHKKDSETLVDDGSDRITKDDQVHGPLELNEIKSQKELMSQSCGVMSINASENQEQVSVGEQKPVEGEIAGQYVTKSETRDDVAVMSGTENDNPLQREPGDQSQDQKDAGSTMKKKEKIETNYNYHYCYGPRPCMKDKAITKSRPIAIEGDISQTVMSSIPYDGPKDRRSIKRYENFAKDGKGSTANGSTADSYMQHDVLRDKSKNPENTNKIYSASLYLVDNSTKAKSILDESMGSGNTAKYGQIKSDNEGRNQRLEDYCLDIQREVLDHGHIQFKDVSQVDYKRERVSRINNKLEFRKEITKYDTSHNFVRSKNVAGSLPQNYFRTGAVPSAKGMKGTRYTNDANENHELNHFNSFYSLPRLNTHTRSLTSNKEDTLQLECASSDESILEGAVGGCSVTDIVQFGNSHPGDSSLEFRYLRDFSGAYSEEVVVTGQNGSASHSQETSDDERQPLLGQPVHRSHERGKRTCNVRKVTSMAKRRRLTTQDVARLRAVIQWKQKTHADDSGNESPFSSGDDHLWWALCPHADQLDSINSIRPAYDSHD